MLDVWYEEEISHVKRLIGWLRQFAVQCNARSNAADKMIKVGKEMELLVSPADMESRYIEDKVSISHRKIGCWGTGS
jgi:hypothetical protein